MSKSRFYSLAYPEHQAMERLFRDFVKAGIILLSSSPLEDVFFVEKKKRNPSCLHCNNLFVSLLLTWKIIVSIVL